MKEHTPKRVVVHCSDTKNGLPVSIDALRKDHIARGFGDVGYHLVIQPDGEAVYTRGLNEVGAHVAGANTGSIGVCLAGKDKFTIEQFNTLRYKLDSFVLTFDIPRYEIHGHREFPSALEQGKSCPGMMTSHLLAWYWLQENDAIKPYILEPIRKVR